MEKERQVQMISSRTFLPIALITMLIAAVITGSCTPQYVDPLTLPIYESDKEEAQFPPTKEELSVRPHLMLSLMVFKGETVTDTRLNSTLSFVHKSFEKYGNFSPIPQKKVRELLSREENKRFQPTNVADAIQLGQSLDATFVAQFQVMIKESQVIENIDHYKTNVNLTIFTTGSGQVVFKKDFIYDTQDLEQSTQSLRKLIQEYFPLRAYILETRGNKQYAKLSIGRSLGIQIDRKFQIRERSVKNEIVMGVSRRTVSFSPLALATVTTVKVTEDTAWVKIEPNDQTKIKKGQVAFSQVEVNSIFD